MRIIRITFLFWWLNKQTNNKVLFEVLVDLTGWVLKTNIQKCFFFLLKRFVHVSCQRKNVKCSRNDRFSYILIGIWNVTYMLLELWSFWFITIQEVNDPITAKNKQLIIVWSESFKLHKPIKFLLAGLVNRHD